MQDATPAVLPYPDSDPIHKFGDLHYQEALIDRSDGNLGLDVGTEPSGNFCPTHESEEHRCVTSITEENHE